MIQVILYNFPKRLNSTALPTSSTTSITLSCLVRKDSSVVNPYLELSNNHPIYNYNYCYIPMYHRYYFIDDIVYGDNIWTVHCKVDVLGSYKESLGRNNQYVLRSASDFNGSIIDTRYPAIVENTYGQGNLINDVKVVEDDLNIPSYFDRNISNGFFVLGVVGENSGGVTYYSVTYSVFKTLINNLMAYTPSDMSDVSTGIAKELANPIQYITSCYWYPYAPVGTQATSIKFGRYSISVSTQILNNADYIKTFRQEISIPTHPQLSSLGGYMSAMPYSEYTLIFQPFGSMSISNSEMGYHSSLYLEWKVDYTTGASNLLIRYSNAVNSNLGFYSAQYGIPIHLSQATVNMIGAIGDVVGGVGSLLGGGFNFITNESFGGSIGAAVSGISGFASGVANAVQNLQPNVNSKGIQGSFLQQTRPSLKAVFHRVVSTSNAIFGRPLCSVRDIDTLSGYVQIANPQVAIYRATKQEIEMIVNFMSNGFYLES